MQDLEGYRQAIDEIDRQLVQLFEQRLDIVLQVADYKEKHQMSVLQADREAVVLQQATERLSNPDYQQEIKALFRGMLQVSRHLQQRKLAVKRLPQAPLQMLQETSEPILGFQGVAGAFSEEALLAFFGQQAKRRSCADFEAVFLALEKEEITYGILPIENSSTGSVNEVYDLILKYGFYIVGEQSLAVQQHLMGLPGATLPEIKEVYSHPQGLAQCSRFLKQYPNWQQIPYHNTAVSAKLIKELGDSSKVAIAGKRAALLYGLTILSEGINDEKDNHTLFILIGRQPLQNPAADKVSLVFRLENQAGALAKFLSIFATHQVNLTKLESRPVKYRPWEYVFYANFEGNLAEKNIKQALEEARGVAKELRILGSYCRSKI